MKRPLERGFGFVWRSKGNKRMCTLPALLLGLSLLVPGKDESLSEAITKDPARLREMLHNRHHNRDQSQAALLLVLSHTTDADEIVRKGLTQTDSLDTFLALTSALRLTRDFRFNEELLAALNNGPPLIRQAAAETLAVLADADVESRLHALILDNQVELLARQAAIWTLGRSGRQSAAPILIEQLSNNLEPLRKAAAEALVDLTGQAYGMEVARWRNWWDSHKDLPNERWLEERLAYQISRTRRLEGDLERSKTQVVRLHQQLYSRLPTADRLRHVQSLVDHEDPMVRGLAVSWSMELLPAADAVGQRALSDALHRLSRDGNLEVQRAAVLALGRLNDARAFDQARLMLRRGQPPVRAAAAHALAQQARGASSAAQALQHLIVPLLQKALDDPALEVVVAAAEDLGTLGVPEAGPVLTGLLKHSSESVRQTAAQALEQVADLKVMEGLLTGLDDPAVTVRFSLVGAISRAVADDQVLTETQRSRLIARLEELVLRDADPGVRSRAATVLGQCCSSAELPFLYRRVTSREDSRVQEKAFAAFQEIIVRSGNLDVLREWDRTLAEARQGSRRLQLLTEVSHRWKQAERTRLAVAPVMEILVQAQLDEGKWAAAFPIIRDLLGRPATDAGMDQRLHWLLSVGELALQEGNRSEALLAVQEAQAFLGRRGSLAAAFERLEKQARQGE